MKLQVAKVNGLEKLFSDELLVGKTPSIEMDGFPAFIQDLLETELPEETKSNIAKIKIWWLSPYKEDKKYALISLYIKELQLDGKYKTYRGTVKLTPVFNIFEKIKSWFKHLVDDFKDHFANA